jgi:hypothetical protein
MERLGKTLMLIQQAGYSLLQSVQQFNKMHVRAFLSLDHIPD